MSERASQTAQRYVDAMNIASAKIEQLQAEVEALRAQVQRVRELHYNTATHHPSGCCSECGGTYPCPTVRALDGGAE